MTIKSGDEPALPQSRSNEPVISSPITDVVNKWRKIIETRLEQINEDVQSKSAFNDVLIIYILNMGTELELLQCSSDMRVEYSESVYRHYAITLTAVEVLELHAINKRIAEEIAVQRANELANYVPGFMSQAARSSPTGSFGLTNYTNYDIEEADEDD